MLGEADEINLAGLVTVDAGDGYVKFPPLLYMFMNVSGCGGVERTAHCRRLTKRAGALPGPPNTAPGTLRRCLTHPEWALLCPHPPRGGN